MDFAPVSALFRALGDESRVRIVALLAHGELCVCHLEEALAMSQPTVSRHLGVLRSAGIVESRRDGTWIYYRLAPQQNALRAQHLEALTKDFASAAPVARDLARLVKTRGPGSFR